MIRHNQCAAICAVHSEAVTIYCDVMSHRFSMAWFVTVLNVPELFNVAF